MALSGLIFATSGLLKLRSPEIVAEWTERVFGVNVSLSAVRVYAVAEVALLFGFMFRPTRPLAAKGTLPLAAGFLAISLARARFDLSGNCGCFGLLGMPPSIHALLASALLVSSIVLLRESKP